LLEKKIADAAFFPALRYAEIRPTNFAGAKFGSKVRKPCQLGQEKTCPKGQVFSWSGRADLAQTLNFMFSHNSANMAMQSLSGFDDEKLKQLRM
jgi:hypothetical protein